MDEELAFNPSERRLCPDGSCVGLLDSGGRCAECGRRWGSAASASAPSPASASGGKDGLPATTKEPGTREPGTGEPGWTGDAEPDGEARAPGVEPGSGFDAHRRLCDDGACVGVVGANGACNVCGRVARS